jgi:N-methylhydantoinase A/oxoprolinase/acetone carboxylase beta subunit
MRRIGVDVGGTFTDLIYVDDESGAVLVHKLPTTPDDPSQGTVQGIRELSASAGQDASALDQVFHGTTIATNIVIEHDGARVGLITTEGYRDILHIARHKKPLNFSNYQDLPWQRYPIVRRRDRLTVPERIDRHGTAIVPLDEERAREQVRRLKEAGVESVAVCFLFSFLNPEHERRVAEIVREEFPDAFLSVSSDVLPQYREYERFSTVCLNAYVGPRVATYVGRLESELRSLGLRTGLHLMTSASGVATPEAAAQRPVNLLMSGPVAGVVGGIWAGKQAGFENVITLDVGGTSADIGLAQEGRLRMKHLLDTRVGPYQAMIPMVDVDTIGAGGGSIAYVDQGGIYRVGPRSAGADPGPAAYDRGGTEPTATDAMVNLGWLQPEAFLGGGMRLRADLARVAFEEGPARSLGMSVEEASMGAVQILTHSMVQSIEENSVRKGYDPRDFALVAAGGAGPLFAAQIALEVGTPYVLVPPYPGVTAAMGLLATDMVYEEVATTYQRLSSLDRGAVQSLFEQLEAKVRAQLEEDGMTAEQIVIHRIADCRYLGQGYELRVDVAAGEIDEAWAERVRGDFHDIHEREYSRRFEDSDIEIPNVRVRGVGLMPALSTTEVEAGDESPDAALRHEGEAWFQVDGTLRQLDTRSYDRAALAAGNRVVGPAIVNQYDTTTVVPPGMAADVDRFGNIVIEVAASAEARALAAAAEAVASDVG